MVSHLCPHRIRLPVSTRKSLRKARPIAFGDSGSGVRRLHPVACGQAVNKAVDNRCRMRITTCSLWISSWIAGKPEMAGSRVLRGACGGSNNAFTAGNGHYPGGDAGNVGGAGRPALARVPGPGGRRGVGKAGRLASRRGEAGHGPSISYMEGPCLILPAGTFCRVRHLRQLRNAGRDDLGSGRAGRAFPGRHAGPEAVMARAAASATDPCRTARVRARKTGCRAVASSDASGGQVPWHRRCRPVISG